MMSVHLPSEIRTALEQNSPLVISVSGGKDSDAMTYELIELHRAEGYSGEMYLIHADLGRAEWKATPDYVQSLAQRVTLPLHIVRHSKYDLLDGIRNRMKVRPEVPPWPSAKYRQCTSDWKREPINRWLRETFADPNQTVICAIGLRSEESSARAKRPIVERRQGCCTYGRTMLNWLPIHHYATDDVWTAIGHSPVFVEHFQRGIRQMIENGNQERANILIERHWKAHPAYALGNHRLSCAMCILADLNDLANGAENDPGLYQAYCDIEIESGFSFRQKLWLGTLKPDLLREDQRAFYEGK